MLQAEAATAAAATAVENVKAQARLCVAMQLSQAIRNLYKKPLQWVHYYYYYY